MDSKEGKEYALANKMALNPRQEMNLVDACGGPREGITNRTVEVNGINGRKPSVRAEGSNHWMFLCRTQVRCGKLTE